MCKVPGECTMETVAWQRLDALTKLAVLRDNVPDEAQRSRLT